MLSFYKDQALKTFKFLSFCIFVTKMTKGFYLDLFIVQSDYKK